jgi:protein SCO1/2
LIERRIIMPNLNRRSWLKGLGTADGKHKWSTATPRERIRDRNLPNVELLTHEGKKVKFYDDLIKDKLVVINFMYASCEGICPTVMLNLARVHKVLGERMGKDIFFYSLTLKPEQDDPKALMEYAEMHGGSRPGWYLLTGSPQNLELLRRKLGFTDPDPERDRDRANHIGNLRYGNEELMRWGACPGMSDVDWIVRSIQWVDWPNRAQAGKGGQK